MDPDSTDVGVRKHRFKPKARPVKREIKTEVKSEVIEDAVDAQAAKLLLYHNEKAALKRRSRGEKKVPASQIAFGSGGASAPIKSFGVHKSNGEQNSSVNGNAYDSGFRLKEYKEPWDYYSNYPVSLPLRRPYSGNPELLDEDEFGPASETVIYSESSENSAADLNLVEENPEPSIMFFQLPPSMPMKKQATTVNDPKPTDRSKTQKGAHISDLPAGLMGKLQVYRSGAVKLKLGDTVYDVAAGLDSSFAQDIVAINTADKNCCIVGEIDKRCILTPDFDSILQSLSDL